MKVLFIQEADRIGGRVKQQQHLAEMFVHRGHEVHVIDNEISKHSEGNKGILLRRWITSRVNKAQKDTRVTVIYPSLIKIPILN